MAALGHFLRFVASRATPYGNEMIWWSTNTDGKMFPPSKKAMNHLSNSATPYSLLTFPSIPARNKKRNYVTSGLRFSMHDSRQTITICFPHHRLSLTVRRVGTCTTLIVLLPSTVTHTHLPCLSTICHIQPLKYSVHVILANKLRHHTSLACIHY